MYILTFDLKDWRVTRQVGAIEDSGFNYIVTPLRHMPRVPGRRAGPGRRGLFCLRAYATHSPPRPRVLDRSERGDGGLVRHFFTDGGSTEVATLGGKNRAADRGLR